MTEKTLLNSLIGYVNDVKPYHTKIKEFLTELFFEDSFNVNITENIFWNVKHQNVWTRDDVDGYKLTRLCEGIELDKVFRIPAAVWPRFSLNDRLYFAPRNFISYNTTPYGSTPYNSISPNGSAIAFDSIAFDSTSFDIEPSLLVSNRLNAFDVLPFESAAFDSETFIPNYTVSPPGDDPATIDKIDSNVNGIPDSEEPWNDPYGRNRSSSHFLGSDFVPGNPRKYRVPFHQGSRVYVDGVQQVFGIDYTVDVTRGFILFAVAPGATQHIEVQLMKVDRLFVAYNIPFDYLIDYSYDGIGYDILPYDADPINPLRIDYFDSIPFDSIPYDNDSIESDYFEFSINNLLMDGHTPVYFYNSFPEKRPKARLTVTGITSLTLNGDVWKIIAIGPWRFKVQRNETGQVWFANFKEPFDNGMISFVIDREWCNYYLVPDNDSYELLLINDPTDFLVDLNVVTEHGVITDPIAPIHKPIQFNNSIIDRSVNLSFESDSPNGKGNLLDLAVTDMSVTQKWTITATSETTFSVVGSIAGVQTPATVGIPYDNGIISFWIYKAAVPFTTYDKDKFVIDINASITPMFPLGKVKKASQILPRVGSQDYYTFVLDNVPDRGTYVELRVEQNGQLNPWMNTSITDDMYLTVRWDSDTVVNFYSSPTFDFNNFDIGNFDSNINGSSLPLIIPAGTERIIHNVTLLDSNYYEELQPVDELVIYHGRGMVPIGVVVSNGPVLPMSLINIQTSVIAQLYPGTIGVDENRVIISTPSRQPINVNLVFSQLCTPNGSSAVPGQMLPGCGVPGYLSPSYAP